MNTHEKGRRWRRAVQTWLEMQGFMTRFRPLGEAGDDITATSAGLTLSVEAKDCQKITLAAFVDQATSNAAPHEIPVAVIHRRGRTSIDDAYFVLDGRSFARLLEHTYKENI